MPRRCNQPPCLRQSGIGPQARREHTAKTPPSAGAHFTRELASWRAPVPQFCSEVSWLEVPVSLRDPPVELLARPRCSHTPVLPAARSDAWFAATVRNLSFCSGKSSAAHPCEMMPSLPWKPSGTSCDRRGLVSIRQRTTGGHVSGWSPNQCLRSAPISSAPRHRQSRASHHFDPCAADLFVQ